MSPLLANIALSVLDQHVHGPWQPGGVMSNRIHRALRRRRGLPNWRIVATRTISLFSCSAVVTM